MYKNAGARDLLCPIKGLYKRKNGRSKAFEMVSTYLGSKECYSSPPTYAIIVFQKNKA